MSTDESCDLFYECISVKASKHKLISNPSFAESENILTTNHHLNQPFVESEDILTTNHHTYFQVPGQAKGSEGYHSNNKAWFLGKVL